MGSMLSGTINLASRAALVFVAMTFAVSGLVAVYESPAPGEALTPVGEAADLVRVDQDSGSIRFEAVTGVVDEVTVRGWPSTVGSDELGGAMMVVAVGGKTGAVEFGEAPKIVEFGLSDRS